MVINENKFINKQSLSKEITGYIKRQILSGYLQQGDQLIVRIISE